MKVFKQQLTRYMDAAFPIIFVNSFEEEKVTEAVREVFVGRGFLEWNVRGIFELDNKSELPELDLHEALEFFLKVPEALAKAGLETAVFARRQSFRRRIANCKKIFVEMDCRKIVDNER